MPQQKYSPLFSPFHSKNLRAEAAVRQERTFSDLLMNIVGALVVVLDRQGRIVRFNEACETMTGYRASEVSGVQFWQLFIPQEDQALFKNYFADIDSLQFPFHRENAWLTKDGAQELISWSNAALRNPIRQDQLYHCDRTSHDGAHGNRRSAARSGAQLPKHI